jgi:putative ABC transport system ATP-binding protein
VVDLLRPDRASERDGAGLDDVMISCRSVVKVYGSSMRRVQALRGVDLTVRRGATVALVGPSGSGKSSLLRIVAGLDQPTAGSVLIDGTDLTMVGDRRRRALRRRLVSHVYQRPEDNLIVHLTALQQVERVAMRRGINPSAAVAMLDQVGLGSRRDHRPSELSGGERQRLAFARAAVGQPSLIIADEPTAELDTASTRSVLDAMAGLADAGITLLIGTHDEQVLARLTSVVTLRDGTVSSVSDGTGEFAVVDEAGRVQIPPDLLPRFASGLARTETSGDSLTVRPP